MTQYLFICLPLLTSIVHFQPVVPALPCHSRRNMVESSYTGSLNWNNYMVLCRNIRLSNLPSELSGRLHERFITGCLTNWKEPHPSLLSVPVLGETQRCHRISLDVLMACFSRLTVQTNKKKKVYEVGLAHCVTVATSWPCCSTERSEEKDTSSCCASKSSHGFEQILTSVQVKRCVFFLNLWPTR